LRKCSVKEFQTILDFLNTKTDLLKLSDRLTEIKNNFNICLYGPPGTGKSEYAKYVADKIGKEILYKRASDLQSKYLGDSEKLIAASFEQAAKDDKVLLIDEGDVFLRDRNIAEKSWEISIVNEMLSQMETNRCKFFLTTNLFDNIDKASLRRFHFKVLFEYTTPEQNMKLFENFFKMPAPESIKIKHGLTPGDFANIKNKIEILEISDANIISDMLQEELDAKDIPRNVKIGF
jgi:SpoVK/Ycf46/Vps4 family AAA+-type ATPase